MIDIMIDLETLGTSPDCPVISIGAIAFDIEKKVLGPTFYAVLDTEQQINDGRKVDGSTLKWWLSQSDAAKKVFKENPAEVKTALNFLVEFVKQWPKVKVWGNGSTFDITIMENLFKHYGVKCPWRYNDIMDLRTFKRFCAGGERIIKSGTAHNALDDARSQAQYVLDALK